MWQMVNPTAGMNAGYSAGYREKDKSEAGGMVRKSITNGFVIPA